MEELGLIEPGSMDESMTRKKLEDLISEPYRKCKKYSRKLDRINNIKEDVLGQKEQNKNEKCCYKLLKCCICCKNQSCECTLFCIFAFFCFLFILDEFSIHLQLYKEVNDDGYCNNTSVDGEIGQYEGLPNVFVEIIACLIICPIIYICLTFGAGVYIIPLLYSLINRKPITGDFLYAENSSDTIDLSESLGKITEMVFPSLYLSSVFYGMIYYSSSSNKENIIFDLDCLTFFHIPQFKLILYYKYIPIIFFIVITRFFERIKLKCIKYTFNISDECYFDEISCKKKCYADERKIYIEEGRKQKANMHNMVPIMNNNNINNMWMNKYFSNYNIDSANHLYNNNNNNINYNNQNQGIF